MFMEVIGIVNNLWFNDKMTWEDKEKINSYIFNHSGDHQLMAELYAKFSYYQDNMNLIPENGITF
jgi:hypothetical protein